VGCCFAMNLESIKEIFNNKVKCRNIEGMISKKRSTEDNTFILNTVLLCYNSKVTRDRFLSPLTMHLRGNVLNNKRIKKYDSCDQKVVAVLY